MTDRFTPEERSRIMSNIRAKNTRPEVLVRRLLHGMGYRFRLHQKNLPGKPDVVLPRHRKIIFVNGCFWHGHKCKRGSRPSSNAKFWNDKIDGNMSRDLRKREELEKLGWNVLTVWECETKDVEQLANQLRTFMLS